MKKQIFLFMSVVVLTAVSCKKKGCIDETATNYSVEAKKDDGSCLYAANGPGGSGGTGQTGTVYEISSNISSNTVITETNITICGGVKVSAGLTIPAGAVIKMCAGASLEISSTGYLKAVGTAAEPIVFKGDTETKGFWQGIAIKSTNPNNILSYVTVKDAGTYWAWENANVFVTGSLAMDHSTISNSNDVGLYVANNAQLGNFSSNSFSNCITGLNLAVPQVGKLDEASNYNLSNSNTNDNIYVRQGVIGVPTTWKKTTTPLLTENLTCEAALTLNPGTKIQMEASNGIIVKSTGSLTSVGTAAEPISITGRYASAGYWEGMSVRSNNPNNIMKYTTIADGGSYWAYEYSNIHLNGGKLAMDNCTISNANSYGIFVTSSSQLSTSGSVQNTVAGVEANNTFTGNGTGANANCTNGCKVKFN